MNPALTDTNYLDAILKDLDEQVSLHGKIYMRDEGVWHVASSDTLWNLMHEEKDPEVVATALKHLWDKSPNGYLLAGHLLDNYDDHPHDENWIQTVYSSVDYQGYLTRYP